MDILAFVLSNDNPTVILIRHNINTKLPFDSHKAIYSIYDYYKGEQRVNVFSMLPREDKTIKLC